jgi:hypothetical protein
MTLDHAGLRELILAYEELEPDERALAEKHLAECRECESLLAELRRAERTALSGSLPEPGEIALGTEERLQADASLAALRARLGLAKETPVPPLAEPPGPPGHEPVREPASVAVGRGQVRHGAKRRVGPPASRWSRRAPVLVPLAAAAAVVIALALWSRSTAPPLVLDARMMPHSGVRGGDQEGWHTGESFVLRLELSAAAAPVVFHVDPSGAIHLLYPDRADATIAPLPAGPVTLPPERAGIEWRFQGEAGAETFLIAASPRSDPPLARIVAEARRIEGSREDRIRALERLVARTIAPPCRVDATHLP